MAKLENDELFIGCVVSGCLATAALLAVAFCSGIVYVLYGLGTWLMK